VEKEMKKAAADSGTQANPPPSDVKIVRTCVDLLEPGDGSAQYYKKDLKNLPAGISSGAMYRDIAKIAWPSFVEFMLAQPASMADMMMVGRLGNQAIAAVGLATQPRMLLATLFMSMNVGTTAMIARCRGAGDRDRARLFLRQALLMAAIFSLVSSVVGYFGAEWMIRFMGTSAARAETVLAGTQYMQVQMIGFATMGITATITAALRAVGDSKTAMRYNIVSNVVNVIFNFLLIEGRLGFPRLEVLGASLATVLGQLAALVMAVYTITRKRRYLHVSIRDDFRPRWEPLREIFNIGIPAMLEQLVMRAGMIIYARIVNSIGDIAQSTHQICINILSMSFMTGQAVAVSSTSLVGQCLGKRRPDMSHNYARRSQTLSLIVAMVIAAFFVFFGKFTVGLYLDSADPHYAVILEEGAKVLLLVALIQPLQSSQFVLAGALRGAGDTKATALITLITILGVRPLVAALTVNQLGLGLLGAWGAMVCDQTVRSTLIMLRYKRGKWMYMAKAHPAVKAAQS